MRLLPPRFENIVAWSGECPIIRIGKEFYSVQRKAGTVWLCFRMAYNRELDHWYHADDEEYFFDAMGIEFRN